MTATRSKLDTARQLANLGYAIFPAVRGKKRPRTDHGHLEATRDSATITQWWAVHPDDNPAIALEASGLLVIGPDCKNRHEDFKRRGLPDTMIVQTGSGPGHLHYVYRLPEGGPHHRMCKSGDYDIMSDGYVLGPGSQTTGEYTLVTPARSVSDLPEAPTWAVAMLRNAKEREPVSLPVADGDEPPVRLSPDALRWWTGEKQARNRSDTLFGIAKDLYRAGATLSTIVTALQNRDVALNFGDGPKYAGRSDAATRYLETARKAAAQVEQEQALSKTIAETIPQPSPSLTHDDSACQVLVMRLQAKVDQLESELAQVREERSRMMQVLRNPKLKGEKITALAVMFESDSAVSREKDRNGWVPAPRPRIAEAAGCSESTVTKHLDRLAEDGILQKRVTRRLNDRGEMISELHVKISDTTAETMKKLAELVPDRPQHGGPRISCPTCGPDAELEITRTVSCTGCGTVLDKKERRVTPSEADEILKEQDAISEPTKAQDQPTVEVPRGSKMRFQGCPSSPASCSECSRPLRNDNERRTGRHSYDCMKLNPMPPAGSSPLFAGGED